MGPVSPRRDSRGAGEYPPSEDVVYLWSLACGYRRDGVARDRAAEMLEVAAVYCTPPVRTAKAVAILDEVYARYLPGEGPAG